MSTQLHDRPAAATQVLIPEARAHRRRRYRRTGVVLFLVGLIVAALIALVAVIFDGGPTAQGSTHGFRAASVTTATPGTVYFRPVLCLAPPYDPAEGTAVLSSPPCDAASSLTEKNLAVTPSGTSGFTSNNVVPDPALSRVPTTRASSEKGATTVLLPALNGLGTSGRGERFVLGPAQMSSTSIQSAEVKHSSSGQWEVDYTTTDQGGVLLDKLAAQDFHQMLAIDLKGLVYSTPFIQPAQNRFSSFLGHGTIGGGLTKARAEHLAKALSSGGR
jgi:SecDF, P1 head subdomain